MAACGFRRGGAGGGGPKLPDQCLVDGICRRFRQVPSTNVKHVEVNVLPIACGDA
jgi:hypothetical protein